MGKVSIHFFWCFIIEFFCIKSHPILIINFSTGLNTQKDIMCFNIFSIQIMTIICCNKWELCFFSHFIELIIKNFLFFHPIGLHF